MVQLYLSVFSLSKLIQLAHRVSKRTFASIVTPHPEPNLSVVFKYRLGLIFRYVPGIKSIPLKQGFEFVQVWKSVPSMAWLSKLYRAGADSGDKLLKSIKHNRSIFTSLLPELASFANLMRFIQTEG